MANIDNPSFIAGHSNFAEFSSVENVNQFSDFFRSLQDKYASNFVRKDRNHNSPPWFETIRDELLRAKGKTANRENGGTYSTLFSKTCKYRPGTIISCCAYR